MDNFLNTYDDINDTSDISDISDVSDVSDTNATNATNNISAVIHNNYDQYCSEQFTTKCFDSLENIIIKIIDNIEQVFDDLYVNYVNRQENHQENH